MTRIDSSGWRAWKPESRGISHFMASVPTQETWISRSAAARTSRNDSSSSSKVRPSERAIRSPASVSFSALRGPWVSLTPQSASRLRTWRLTAPWVTQSSSAARLILPRRAKASNALRAVNGSWLRLAM